MATGDVYQGSQQWAAPPPSQTAVRDTAGTTWQEGAEVAAYSGSIRPTAVARSVVQDAADTAWEGGAAAPTWDRAGDAYAQSWQWGAQPPGAAVRGSGTYAAEGTVDEMFSQAYDQAEEEALDAAIREGPGEFWGVVHTPRGRGAARKICIAGEDGLQVTLTNYGARVTSVRMPDCYGSIDEVVLGMDTTADYEKIKDFSLGCVIGRMSCPLIGISQHDGHHIFEQMVWDAHLASASHVVFSLFSPAGEQGYTGDVLATAEYRLEPGNRLLLRLTAACTAPTPLSLSARLAFNLAGQRTGRAGLLHHRLMVNSRKHIEKDKDGMLTGDLLRSRKHGAAFLAPVLLEEALHRLPAEGCDHHVVLNGDPDAGIRFAARLNHRDSGRCIEIYSNTRCMHIDTLNNLSVILPEGEVEVEGQQAEGQQAGTQQEEGQLAEVQLEQDPEAPKMQPRQNKTISFADQDPWSATKRMYQEEEGEGLDSYRPMAEMWGEGSPREDYGEAAGDIGGSAGGGGAGLDIGELVEDTPQRSLRDLHKQCAILLAPEDYPDTIFDKKAQFTLLPGQRYERLVRYTFSTSRPPPPPRPTGYAEEEGEADEWGDALFGGPFAPGGGDGPPPAPVDTWRPGQSAETGSRLLGRGSARTAA